jgi:predicted RNase H-like HicB family nuclease
MNFVVIFEQGPTSVGAYVPDLPGCVAVWATQEEAQTLIREAIRMHLMGMQEDGEPLPTPVSSCAVITLPSFAA